MLRKIFFVVFTLLTIWIIIRCDTTDPPINDIKPGKRDYIWSIDSVDYGNLPSLIQLESIWGSSATDVWGVNGDAPDVRDCLWHYDGVKWVRAIEGTPITAGNGNIVVYSVWGSAQNNVWAFGRKINQGSLSAFIMHYNGIQWVDATPANVAALSANLYCVYGAAANNIWVGGYEYALHYNGSNWNTYKVADSIIVGSISGNGKYLYLTTYSPYNIDLRAIYLLRNNSFIIIDQAPNYPIKFGLSVWARQNDLKTFADGVISTQIKNDGTININGWIREFTTQTFLGGRGAYVVQTCKNVFAVGQWNLVYHYNGTDWTQIYINVPNHTVDPLASLWGVWTNGSEVFICDRDNGIVYHGR